MLLEELKEKVRSFPDQPGVYQLKDKSGRIIYVGKALSLCKRVRAYLAENVSGSPRLKALQRRLADIDYIVTDNEVEALILECNLIKEYKPRFNVIMKDDKDYPYLLITPELYPRLELLRLTQKGSKRGRYEAYPGREEKMFGPYTDVGAVKETLQFLGSAFPLRRCRQPLDGRPAKARPCLNYQMKRCLAPCRGEEHVPPEKYCEMVRQIEMFLQGSFGELEEELKEKMQEEAAREHFEEAALLRDRLQALEIIARQQQKMLQAANSPDRDILALVRLEKRVAVQLFQVRKGKLLNQEHFPLQGTEEMDDPEVVSSFIKSYYHRLEEIPREILYSVEPAERELLENWLKIKAGRKVRLHRPQRGALKKLMDLAYRNGMLYLEEAERAALKPAEEPLEELGRLVGLEGAPERIEAFDISHLQGDEPVGSMVVFLDGEPYSSAYRRFNIRQAGPGDDYAALKEVLRRRASNHGWPRPDLLFIDGGRGQLTVAREALRGTELETVPLLALAENPDRLFLESGTLPVRLAAFDPLLHLLQRIRDEAHRFALSGHRARKRKTALSSSLELVPGIGPARRKALLKHFGSMEKLGQARAEELAQVPGISLSLARQLEAHFEKEV